MKITVGVSCGCGWGQQVQQDQANPRDAVADGGRQWMAQHLSSFVGQAG